MGRPSLSPIESCTYSRLLLSVGGRDTEWMLLQGSVSESEASAVLDRSSSSPERELEVVLALSPELGRRPNFFAWLPTQEPVGLPFHVQGPTSFRPTTESASFGESDYRSEWNRVVLRAAGATLAVTSELLENLPRTGSTVETHSGCSDA